MALVRKMVAFAIVVALLLTPIMGQAGAAHAGQPVPCHGTVEAAGTPHTHAAGKHAPAASAKAAMAVSADALTDDAGGQDRNSATAGDSECCMAGCGYIGPATAGFFVPGLSGATSAGLAPLGLIGRILSVETPPPRRA